MIQRVMRAPAMLILSMAVVAALISAQVNADEPLGVVTRSQNMPDYPSGKEIYGETSIETGADQRIAIETPQGDVLVANSHATIRLEKPGFFSQLFGKIYYLITPRDNRNVTIRTRAATIGIRGTRFVVDSDLDDSSKENVALVEGRLNFQSNDDESFALYDERELTEFEQYRRQQLSEFQAYKEQMMEEFVAFKASFDLEAGYALSFDGKKVVRRTVEQEMEAEIAEFERFIADNPGQTGVGD